MTRQAGLRTGLAGLATAGMLCIAVLSACGGSGGGDEKKTPITVTDSPIAASSLSAQQCATDNPLRGDAVEPTSAGSLTTEKAWIRSYINEAYLWYDQVPTVNATDPAYSGSMTSIDTYGVPLPLSNYFEALKTTSTTASGALTDKFSFTYPTKAWADLSQSGITAGYGIEWSRGSDVLPRSWWIGMVQSGSPAANAGLKRGDTLTTVDGIDFVNANDDASIAAINNALLPSGTSTHTFTFTRAGSPITLALTASTNVIVDPVPVATVINHSGANVGYLQFTDHIASSEAKLIAAINNFKNQSVTDLVLDMRYNGGGYLFLASELAYMIAGPTHTSGKYFEKLVYNAKRSSDNTNAPTPFYNTSCILNSNYECDDQQPLPTLNLNRVFVITQGATCSASESIINSLRGIDVEVILIGGTTCGKPYGFHPKDNCGVSYMAMEFKGVNSKGFGDYSDGFTPVTSGTSDTNLIGCPQNDDPDHNLGDASERMLATALQRMNLGTCMPKSGMMAPTALAMRQPNARAVGNSLQSQLRQNRMLLPTGKVR